MEVKIHERDYQTDKIPIFFYIFILICCIVFAAITVNYFRELASSGNAADEKLIALLIGDGLAAVFFYILFGGLLKPAKRYKAMLTHKEVGKNSTEMEFDIKKAKGNSGIAIRSNYPCYTMNDNYLQEGHYYALYIKELNWRPTRVEELNGKNTAERMGSVKMGFVLKLFVVMYGGLIIYSIIGMSRALVMHADCKEYFQLIGFSIVSILFMAWKKKKWDEAEKADQSESFVGRGEEKGVESLPVNMMTPDFFLIKMTGNSFSKRDIFDGKQNLILSIESDQVDANRHYVKDCNGKEMAQISYDLIIDTYRFTIALSDGEPFYVLKRVEDGITYEVDGLDYVIEECKNESDGIESGHVIRNRKEKTIANITRREKDSIVDEAGELDVHINPDCENNIYILLMAVCVSEQYESH